jgi:membrane-associated phospholipid phosphatase
MAGLGKWWSYVPLASVLSLYLIETAAPKPRTRRSAMAGAEAILLSGLGAAVLSQVFDRTLPQPPAPPGHKKKRKPVFPSGHAFGPGAVGWTAAYVFSREGRVQSGWAAVPAVLYPAFMVSGKLVEEKHWASDALGGLLAALALSAGSAALYEVRRGTR